jgi:AcrR family transcriptional regulator
MVQLQVAFHTDTDKNKDQGVLFEMVQKEAPRRGRPRLYDPDIALGRAIDVFWELGYSGTSLDVLCAAMNMNRPSLYAAFGDKHELFIKALGRYQETVRARFRTTLAPDRPLLPSLRQYFAGMLDRFFSGESARGCFMMSVATLEAAQDPAIRAVVVESTRALDAGFEARFRHAQRQGELARSADPGALARLASGLVHTLAVRARAGEARAALEDVIDAFLAVLEVKAPAAKRQGVGERSR